MFINNPGHMTKMDTMPIYGKNFSKIFLGMKMNRFQGNLACRSEGEEYMTM